MCRFDISDIARITGIKTIRKSGGETYAECPFCGDRRGKFSYIVKKGSKENMFKCWHCDEGGTAIDLYMKLRPKAEYEGADGYKSAIRDIFKDLGNDTEYTPTERSKEEEVAPEVERANNGVCSSVYYALLKLLKLKDKHKKDLLRRGFTEADIKRFRFKSVPAQKEISGICKTLIKAGYNLEGVPGFYLNSYGKWSMKLPMRKVGKRWEPHSGYFCPVFDGERNLILGFQIRIDEPQEGQAKYLWFSSASKDKGVSSGAISSYLPGEGNIVIITEGILKSLAIYSLLNRKVSVIGVPGVKAIKSLEGVLNTLESEVYAVEAYDMDKAIKTEDEKLKEKTERLAEDTKRLHETLELRNIPYHPLKWDMDKEGKWKGNFKGLDDFLVSYEDKDAFLSYLNEKANEELKIREFFG